MSGKRIFFYVQHLLGVGHLRRAVTLSGAAASAGLEVTLASGGRPVPGLAIPPEVNFVQLPPVAAADLSFKQLMDEAGAPIDERWRQRRRDALLAAWRAFVPHAIVLELFPFGRRQMRFELLALLEEVATAKPRPLVVSSVRDLLAGGARNPERESETLALLERYFDAVLVHGDPTLIAFEQSFGHAARIAAKLHYTGYVIEPVATEPSTGPTAAGEVLVSVGGGAVGQRLLETAIRARQLSVLAERPWRLLAGVNAAPEDLAALRTLAAELGGGQIVVERARSDFRRLLAQCALSVSQAGYNTVLETLQAGARAVVVPFSGGRELEQGLRAGLLAENELLEVIDEATLAPRTLAAAIDRVWLKPHGEARRIDMDGAARSAALLAGWTATGAL